ncbi:MAG TPA: hypothetical protein VFJ97_13865 [Dermatophilaceae bacterium]|nr:hypothetical protein [Dermatophilaceae bacterium]
MTTATAYPSAQPPGAVSVEELQRAWRAVQAGQFRRPHPKPAQTRTTASDPACASPPSPRVWVPAEPVLPVLGCAGSVGASTVALALASVATGTGGTARVVECCTATASGLAGASTAELGQHPSGWVQGTRGQILLERASDILVGPDNVPLPANSRHPVTLTVLDIGWELGQLLASSGWLGDQVLQARRLVAVTTATIPGLRRLEGALAMLQGIPVAAAVVGPRRRNWPRMVHHSMGALTRQLDRDGDLHQVPYDRDLANRGLDSAPLSTALLTAVGELLHAGDGAATTTGKPS